MPEKKTTRFLNPGKGAASPKWQKVDDTEIWKLTLKIQRWMSVFPSLTVYIPVRKDNLLKLVYAELGNVPPSPAPANETVHIQYGDKTL